MIVRHFYAYARLARHRSFDTNAHCREVKCDIVCKTRYLRHSYACCRLKLISCNGRTSVYAHDPCFSAICFKRFHKLRRFLLYLLLDYLGSHRIFSIFEYIHRRINVSRYFIIFLKERCLTVLINIHYRWLNRLVLGLLFFSAVAYGVFYYLLSSSLSVVLAVSSSFSCVITGAFTGWTGISIFEASTLSAASSSSATGTKASAAVSGSSSG